MGIDPAPQIANLHLYDYEARFIEKGNYGVAKGLISQEDLLMTLTSYTIMDTWRCTTRTEKPTLMKRSSTKKM